MSDGFATLVASLLAGGFVIVGLVISKESKVSEFRQQWIDGLRADVSSLIAAASAIQVRPMETSHFRDLTMQLKEFECRIALRFKKGDPEGEALLFLVGNVVLQAIRFEGTPGVENRLDNLKEAARELLKNEWERVKKGEPNYIKTLRITRSIVWTLLVVSGIWILFHFIAATHICWLPKLFRC